ncbi:hypothetical protein FN846DRAFT_138618 [Sphaerosporella brunnea]|uniref:Uncharacterized protein n=1 Tax=Sphaerosporella brunnea TaxID=1250544 RepID=A0A5J5ERA5_9PEZI|nr:hypothetical protein FN846DRAFT_138618 [Sphaerosporella brunnea]
MRGRLLFHAVQIMHTEESMLHYLWSAGKSASVRIDTFSEPRAATTATRCYVECDLVHGLLLDGFRQAEGKKDGPFPLCTHNAVSFSIAWPMYLCATYMWFVLMLPISFIPISKRRQGAEAPSSPSAILFHSRKPTLLNLCEYSHSHSHPPPHPPPPI